MVVHAALQTPLHILRKRVGSHGDNGNIRVLPLQRPDGRGGLVAVHHGHAHIHQNRVVIPHRRLLQFCDAVPPVLNPVQLHFKNREHRPRHFPVELVILRQQNTLPPQHRINRLVSAGGLLDAGTGKRAQRVNQRGPEQRLGDEAGNPRFSGLVRRLAPVAGHEQRRRTVLPPV